MVTIIIAAARRQIMLVHTIFIVRDLLMMLLSYHKRDEVLALPFVYAAMLCKAHSFRVFSRDTLTV